jgi:hypothetical protein
MLHSHGTAGGQPLSWPSVMLWCSMLMGALACLHLGWLAGWLAGQGSLMQAAGGTSMS